MKKYYVNKNTDTNPNNNHEVHVEGCKSMPEENNREFLGEFNSCEGAVKEAGKSYDNVDGCAICCPDCHKA